MAPGGKKRVSPWEGPSPVRPLLASDACPALCRARKGQERREQPRAEKQTETSRISWRNRNTPEFPQHLGSGERAKVTHTPSSSLPAHGVCACLRVTGPPPRGKAPPPPILTLLGPHPMASSPTPSFPRIHVAGAPCLFSRNISAPQPQITFPRRRGKTPVPRSGTPAETGVVDVKPAKGLPYPALLKRKP